MTTLSLDILAKVGPFSLKVSFGMEGGITAVLGASGAGKTLTLRSIAGLLRPQTGRITLGDRVLFDSKIGHSTPSRQRRIGYLFQQYALFPHVTVSENLAYGLAGWSRSEVLRRVGELVELLQLQGLEARRPSQLSGGQQQRVALGRALAPQPDLLLLDEPFSAVDLPTRAVLTEQFLKLQHHLGFAALLVTHDVEEAYGLAGKLVVLDEGQLIQHGPREEVFGHPASPAAARVLGFRNLWEGCVRRADATGTTVAVGGVTLTGPASSLFRGTPVTVGVRSTEVSIVGSDHATTERSSTTLPVKLLQQIDKGSRQVLLLDLSGAERGELLLHLERVVPIADKLLHDDSSPLSVTIPYQAVHVWPRF